MKTAIAVAACLLLCSIGMALASSAASQQYGTVMSSTSHQQVASSSMATNYDWLSPGGVASVRYYGWHYPYSRYWYYPAPAYRHYWYDPFYYNDFDPWWTANVYGPFRTTYYWYSW